MKTWFENDFEKIHWWRFRLILVILILIEFMMIPIVWSFINGCNNQ